MTVPNDGDGGALSFPLVSKTNGTRKTVLSQLDSRRESPAELYMFPSSCRFKLFVCSAFQPRGTVCTCRSERSSFILGVLLAFLRCGGGGRNLVGGVGGGG